MPTYRKRPSNRRSKPYTKKHGVSDSVKKYVKSVTKKTRPEMKYTSAINTDVTEVVLALDSATLPGFSYAFFGNVPPGTGANERIGQEFFLQGFHSKITYFNNSPIPVYVRRLVLSVPGSDADAATTSAELFSRTGTGTTMGVLGNNMSIIQTPINLSTYRVYYDKTIRLGPSTATDGSNTRMVNYFTKFGGKKILCEGSLGGTKGQNWIFLELILAVTASNDIAAGATLEFNRFNRTYFTDP